MAKKKSTNGDPAVDRMALAFTRKLSDKFKKVASEIILSHDKLTYKVIDNLDENSAKTIRYLISNAKSDCLRILAEFEQIAADLDRILQSRSQQGRGGL